jgi:hypothetical protein
MGQNIAISKSKIAICSLLVLKLCGKLMHTLAHLSLKWHVPMVNTAFPVYAYVRYFILATFLV